MSHLCARRGCPEMVGDRFLMCRADWARVPRHLQRAVYAAYRYGAGVGTAELAAAQDAAIQAVGEKSPEGS